MSEDTQYIDEAADGGPPARFITYRLARLHGKLSAQAAAVLSQHTNLSLVQLRILAQLRRHDGTAVSSDIASELAMDRGLLSRTLKNLIDMGYVVAKTDDVDRRRQHMSITSAGRAEHERVVPMMYRRHEHLMHGLTADEQNALFDALDKLEAGSLKRDFAV